MLKNYCFKNYEDFKEIFGYRKTGDGKMVRKNKILLSLYKDGNDKPLRERMEKLYGSVESVEIKRLFQLSSIQHLDAWFKRILEKGLSTSDDCKRYNCIMDGKYAFYSFPDEWYCDNDGICNDPKTRDKVRFISNDGDRRREMCCTPARLLKKIIENYAILSLLPLQIKRHFEELFAEDWKAYLKSFENIELVVNDTDFYKIYDSDYLSGEDCCNGIFNSCMVDKGFHGFYEMLPDCQCAYLLRCEKIIARCIIFKAYDSDGKSYFLAERQYSTDDDDSLKRLLVDKLIEGGHIDGYKKVGAGCAETRAFVLNDGTSLSDKTFYIETDCSSYIDEDGSVPYMDSFCYYNEDEDRAYNSKFADFTHELRDTDGTAERRECVWSDYHQQWLYAHRDDFSYVNYLSDYILDAYLVTDRWGDPILEDDALVCPVCGEYFRDCDGYYSHLTDEHYCTHECLCEAEGRWREENEEEMAEAETESAMS